MAKRVIDDSTLTDIADPLRSLLGMSDSMSPAAMATNLGTANDHVDDQTALIAQIIEALEGKTAGGSGGIEILKYTPTTAVTKPVIEHSLGVVPHAAILIAESDPNSVTMTKKSPVYGFTKWDYHNIAPYSSTGTLTYWEHEVITSYGITSNISGTVSNVLFCNATETSIKILNGGNSLSAGVTYLIILFAEGVWE